MTPQTASVALDEGRLTTAALPANRDINLRVERGTTHGIVGENGAGKSTLMSILYGFYRPDAGEIRVNGQPLTITDSQAAIRAGIGMVFQHFKLVRNFSVLENVILTLVVTAADSGARAARPGPRRIAASRT